MILSISKGDESEGTTSRGGSFSLEDGGDGSKLWLQAAKALSRWRGHLDVWRQDARAGATFQSEDGCGRWGDA